MMDHNVNPLEQLAEGVGLSVFDLAQMLDTTPGVVEAWLCGVVQPSLRSRESFEALLAIFEAVFDRMTPAAGREWLVSASMALDGEAPVDVLKRGDIATVLELVEALPRSIRVGRAAAHTVLA
jgi:hypothetical protein